MTPLQIAKAVGFHHNGEWLVDEAKFVKAILFARKYNDPLPTGDQHGNS